MLVEIEIPPGDSEFVVRAALHLLEALVEINLLIMSEQRIPHLYESGIKYRQEPPGPERFDNCARVIKRGWGDCDDLAAWRVAELRRAGETGAKCKVVWQSGHRRYHAQVERADGTTEDPCRTMIRKEAKPQ